jgi:hypothetical protein
VFLVVLQQLVAVAAPLMVQDQQVDAAEVAAMLIVQAVLE